MKFTNRYPLKPFKQCDVQKLKRVIRTYPLATLISQGEVVPTVTQVPLIFDATESKLLGHFDKNNPHCEYILQGGNIYCTFNGPNHYITPSIYPDTQYPGWNYVSVHVIGTVRPVQDVGWLKDLLMRMAEEYEPPDSGYQLTPSQKNFSALVRMITGFEIDIIDMKGVFKLAQDKGPERAELARRHLARTVQKDVGDFLRDLLG